MSYSFIIYNRVRSFDTFLCPTCSCSLRLLYTRAPAAAPLASASSAASLSL
jgi:hypothetical protein